ncbi:hypothetical protein FACS1894195_4920 [Bacteroidia bacterium]|nr:hypothetical protein FACS1894195_4920 [Bacteroidia bacterium]
MAVLPVPIAHTGSYAMMMCAISSLFRLNNPFSSCDFTTSNGHSGAYSSEYASEHADMEQSDKSIDQEGSNQEIIKQYLSYFNKAKALMMDKNHDYDEAWRSMRISSYTDLILMKIKRTKQIEDNKGSTLISEGIDANYYDMINYGVFALIRLTL